MSHESECKHVKDLTDLRKRIDALESPGIRRWLVRGLVPAIAIPLAVTLLTHCAIERPAESDEFEGQFDYRYHPQKGNSYVLKITNAGWRRANDVLGRAEVRFNTKITDIETISVPPNTTFGDRHYHDTRVCQTYNGCNINWGGLAPEGALEIVFYTKGPPAGFPAVHYGGKRVSKWRCSQLPDELSRYCRGNEP